MAASIMEVDEPTKILIERARNGDQPAFAKLVERCRGRLGALIQSRLGARLRRKVALEDVLQETLLRALRSLHRFHCEDDDSFVRWLGGIATNVLHEIARREKHDFIIPLEHEVSGDQTSPSKAEERNERFDRLQAALNSLSNDHRQVVLLARVERLSMKEVARRMHRSPEAVTQLLWRALRKLKESFGNTDSFHLPPRRLEDKGGPDAAPGNP
jgi:RNA polymerase sigma-70 factor (ECF subfamily)